MKGCKPNVSASVRHVVVATVYYCGLCALFYRLNRKAKRIITFHNVLPDELMQGAPSVGCMDRASDFTRAVDEMAKRYKFSTDVSDASTITITFDDGMLNQYEVVGRILQERGVPAILFVAGDAIGATPENMLIVDQVLLWLRYAPDDAVERAFGKSVSRGEAHVQRNAHHDGGGRPREPHRRRMGRQDDRLHDRQRQPARRQGIARRTPRRGLAHELFTDFKENDIGLGVRCYVLSPSKEFYEQLLPSFSSTPSEGEFSGGARLSYTGNEVDAKKALLTDDGKTSAENESSSVLCLALPRGELILLTGDAGMDALNNCLLNAKLQGLNLSANIRVFKVPHHGSIQNLSGELLDGILGDSCSARLRKTAYAMVMVSKHPAKGHPDKIVTNNIWQRNCKPYKTGGSTLSYGVGEFPDRGWGPATPIEKFDRVDQVV